MENAQSEMENIERRKFQKIFTIIYNSRIYDIVSGWCFVYPFCV